MNTLALIVCIVGLLVYLILSTASPNPPRPIEAKLSQAGFWAYAIGLAVFLLSAAQVMARWVG